MEHEPPAQWPWERLFVFGLGCGLTMVGVYVVMFEIFRSGLFEDGISSQSILWGSLGIVVGIILLGAPWFPSGPLAKKWKQD